MNDRLATEFPLPSVMQFLFTLQLGL